MHVFISKSGIKRNRASAASEKIFEKMIVRLYKANILICAQNSHFYMLKLNIKLLIDSPKIDHGAFVAIGRKYSIS